MRNKKKKKSNLPSNKKEIQDFLFSEEGKITKKDIAKIGTTLAAISFLMPSEGAAQAHTSALNNPARRGEHVSHSSHGSHGSHGSHSSHGHGAW